MAEKPPMESTLERHPEYAKALGMISVEMASLEVMLGEMLAAFLGIHRKLGHIIYLTPQSFMGRLQILENVAAASLGADCDGLQYVNMLFKRVKARIESRNTGMHSAWGVSPDNPDIVTRRKVPFIPANPVIPVALKELTDEIKKLREISEAVREETKAIRQSRAEALA